MDQKELTDREVKEKHEESQTRKTDVLGFLGFAMITYVLYTSILISAQDILASTNIATTSIISCFNTPYFVMTLVMPYYIDKISLMSKAVASAVFFGLGLILIALIHTPLRLIGVVVASIGMGTAEIGFLSATSLHQDVTIHSFTCGTGLGAIIGTIYISGVTTILCIKPTTALLILLVLLPIFPLLSWLVTQKTSASRKAMKTSQGSHVEFTRIGEKSSEVDLQNLTWKEKLLTARDNLYLAIPLFIGLFCDYLTMHAIVTTLAFDNSPFDPRDHFQYYQLAFWLAEIVGRSYGLVILSCKPTCTVVTNKTWIFSAIIAANMILLICASWYRFLPSFGIAAVLVAITGATEGALYLNTFALAGRHEGRPRDQEFSRAFLTTALQGGIVVAALLGFFVEPKLKEHCRQILAKDSLCFTRLSHGQWNATSSCLVR